MVSSHVSHPCLGSWFRPSETRYWTETNIANGLNALAICIEVTISQKRHLFIRTVVKLLHYAIDGFFLDFYGLGLQCKRIHGQVERRSYQSLESIIGLVSTLQLLRPKPFLSPLSSLNFCKFPLRPSETIGILLAMVLTY